MNKERWESFNRHYRFILLYRYLQLSFNVYPFLFMFILVFLIRNNDTRSLSVYFLILNIIFGIYYNRKEKSKDINNLGFNQEVYDYFMIKTTKQTKCDLNKIDIFLNTIEEAHLSLWHPKFDEKQCLMKFAGKIIDRINTNGQYFYTIKPIYTYFYYNTLILSDVTKFLIGERNFDKNQIDVNYIIMVAEFIEDEVKTFLNLENVSKYNFKILIGYELSSGRFFFRNVYGFFDPKSIYNAGVFDKNINKGMNILLNEIINVNKMRER